MGRLLRARWAGTALAAVALVVAVLPGPVLSHLLAELTGRPVVAPAEFAVSPVASTTPKATRWQSARPWSGSTLYAGPNRARGSKPAAKSGARSGAKSGSKPRPRAVAFGPTRPQPPVPPVDPVPPGPLEPPNRPSWIGAPTPPHCPWPLDTPMPADWHCQMQPRYDCPQYTGPDAHVLLTATPGAGTATLSWWNYGDPDVQYYRVAAIRYTARGSPNPIWQNVVVPGGCRDVSARITGLTSGERYEFMLEAVATNHAGRGVALHRGIGRSDLIRIG